GAAITSWQIAPSMFALGLGMGIVVPSLIDAALADVPAVHAGSASGVTNTMMQLGGAVGVAVIGVLFFGFLGAGATRHHRHHRYSGQLPHPGRGRSGSRRAGAHGGEPAGRRRELRVGNH
ncbi:MAG: hypothetical protein ACRDP7_01910, partial [Trebonia sp.]